MFYATLDRWSALSLCLSAQSVSSQRCRAGRGPLTHTEFGCWLFETGQTQATLLLLVCSPEEGTVSRSPVLPVLPVPAYWPGCMLLSTYEY